MAELQVLLLAPNLVGQIRLCLLLTAVAAAPEGHPAACTLALLASLALDALDGYLARRLGQATAFGALYDVALDNAARAVLWTWGAISPAAIAPVLLECFTFACLHKEGGAGWKTGCFASAPPLVRAVMRNGFRSPLGALAVTGLMGCPLWLWARRHAGSLPSREESAPWGRLLLGALGWGGWGWVFVPGRALAAAVEVWVVWRHVRGLLREDAAARSPAAREKRRI